MQSQVSICVTDNSRLLHQP